LEEINTFFSTFLITIVNIANMKNFSKNLHSLSKTDFDIKDISSYTYQYRQIADFNSLYQPITNILLFFFVYTMFILFLTALGSFKDGGLLQSGNGFIYILLFTIYLTILIQSVINKPAK